MRRIMFWVIPTAVFVLPLWVMFGRGLFGVPLGPALFGQAFMAPLLGILLAAVALATLARKEVRGPKRVSWHDVRAVGPWLLLVALIALVVVDGDGDSRASVLTSWFGDGVLPLSTALTAIFTIAILVAGVVLVIMQTRLLMLETKARVTTYLDGMGVQSSSPLMKDAMFERVDPEDAPQAGRTIRLEPGTSE